MRQYSRPMITPACVGCGECCKKVQCVVGAYMAGKPEERCSYLHQTILASFEVTVWRCALMEGPDGEKYKAGLAAGAGCCMPMFNNARRVLELELFLHL